MKKIVLMILLLALTVGLVGCPPPFWWHGHGGGHHGGHHYRGR